MAEMLNADMLMILTSVENVSINYGTPDEKPLEHITVADAKKYIAEPVRRKLHAAEDGSSCFFPRERHRPYRSHHFH